MGFLCLQTTRQVSMVAKCRLWNHNFVRQSMLLVFISFAPQQVFVRLFLPFLLFQGFGGSIESGWGWETGSRRHGRSFRPRQCTDFCASNYQCVGVLSKKLGLWFLLFFSVYCGLGFKWDANVIYSAWHDAVREDWTLQGNANLSRERLLVSNVSLWVMKEQSSMAYGEAGE